MLDGSAPWLAAPALRVESQRSIRAVEVETWDAMFAGRGSFTHASLRMLEDVFARGERPEDRWDFHYLVIRDDTDQIVLATFYTATLVKDDMFAPADASRQLEIQRRAHPYYLTARAVMLGCLNTQGEHLYLDRTHPRWRDALRIVVDRIQNTADATQATQVLLREFAWGDDAELRDSMLDLGFTEYRLPDVSLMEDLSWSDHDGYVRRLGAPYRSDIRREVLRFAPELEVVTERPTTAEEIRECYALYQSVHDRAFELNVFPLPLAFFEAMSLHADYDVIRVYRNDAQPRRPAAVMFSFVGGGTYSAMIVGLDYDHVRSHNVYKQILYQTVHRARSLECRTLDLAYTAILAKKKVGARPHPRCAYIQLADHYAQTVIDSLAGAKGVVTRSHRAAVNP